MKSDACVAGVILLVLLFLMWACAADMKQGERRPERRPECSPAPQIAPARLPTDQVWREVRAYSNRRGQA